MSTTTFDTCRLCGRVLTDETSRRVGLGPECRGQYAVVSGDAPDFTPVAARKKRQRRRAAERADKAAEARRPSTSPDSPYAGRYCERCGVNLPKAEIILYKSESWFCRGCIRFLDGFGQRARAMAAIQNEAIPFKEPAPFVKKGSRRERADRRRLAWLELEAARARIGVLGIRILVSDPQGEDGAPNHWQFVDAWGDREVLHWWPSTGSLWRPGDNARGRVPLLETACALALEAAGLLTAYS